MFNRQSEWQEALIYIERDLLEPSKVALQGNLFCWSFIDVVKGLFKVIGDFQLGEVLEPCFNDQFLVFVQVVCTPQKQVAVVHQGPSLFVCQTFAYPPADMFQAPREQFEDVELVYDQMCMR